MYLNTQSALLPALDAVGASLAENAKNEAQLRGLAPALAATGVTLPQQQGSLLSRALGGLGFGGDSASAPVATAPQAPSPSPAPAPQPAGNSPLAG